MASSVFEGMKRIVVRAEDRECLEFDWGRISWLDNAELTGREALTVGLVEIEGGQANDCHRHDNCDEALFLLAGRLNHAVGDKRFELTAGDLIHIPAGVKHWAENPGDTTAEMVVVYDTGRREMAHEAPTSFA